MVDQEHTELHAVQTEQRQSLPPCAYRPKGHRCLKAKRHPREQGDTAVVLAAVRNFIIILAKQGLSRKWQKGEWHNLRNGPSRYEWPHSNRAHGYVFKVEQAQLHPWLHAEGRHCLDSIREVIIGTWRDQAGPLKKRQAVNAGGWGRTSRRTHRGYAAEPAGKWHWRKHFS